MKAEAEGVGNGGIQEIRRGVFIEERISVADGNRAAAEEPLLHGAAEITAALSEDGSDTLRGVGQGHAAVTEAGGFLESGIEVLGNGADLGNGGIASAGAVAGITATAYARCRLTTQNTLATGDAGGLAGATLNAGERATGFGALQAPFEERRLIAGKFNVNIVIQREGNGVLGGKVERAAADETGEAPGIGETDAGDFGGQVGPLPDPAFGADGLYGLHGDLLGERCLGGAEDGEGLAQRLHWRAPMGAAFTLPAAASSRDTWLISRVAPIA